MGGINFSPILFILSKKLYLCIKQESFSRTAMQITEVMTVAKSLPRPLRKFISSLFLIYSYFDIEFYEKLFRHLFITQPDNNRLRCSYDDHALLPARKRVPPSFPASRRRHRGARILPSWKTSASGQ